jgi:hypothetical protein
MNKHTALAVLSLALAVPAYAATLAYDSAADATYDDGWHSGDNGGSGFGPWTLTNVSPTGDRNGHIIQTSTGNGDAPSGNIDTASRAFGLYANQLAGPNGLDIGYATAARNFTGGEIAVGQSLLISMDNGFVGSWALGPSAVGFSLNRFSFFFAGGGTEYRIGYGDPNDVIGTTGTGVPFTDDGLDLVFTRTGTDSYQLEVTPIGGSTTTINGTLPQTGGSLDSILLYNRTAGPGSSNDVFFNNLAIVPEPATLGALAGLALVALRRRA